MGGPGGNAIDSFDGVLSHHGVKGMKWGVRKAEVTTGSGSGGSGAPAKPRGMRTSDDVKNVDKQQEKIEKYGTRVLTNKEMQDVITRMNLEQQYSKLHADTPIDAHVDKIFKNLDRAQKLYNYTQSPGGKAVIKNVKIGFNAAKRFANSPAGRAATGAALLL